MHIVLNQESGCWYSTVLLFPSCSNAITLLTVPPVPGNIFTAVHLLPLGVFFLVFSPSGSPVSESFFPALSSPEVGWCIYGFIAVPVPEVKRQPWGNPTAGSAAPLDTQ